MPAFPIVSFAGVRGNPVHLPQAVVSLRQRSRSPSDLAGPDPGTLAAVAPAASRIAAAAGTSLLRRAHVIGGLLGATLAAVGRPVHALAVRKGSLTRVEKETVKSAGFWVLKPNHA